MQLSEPAPSSSTSTAYLWARRRDAEWEGSKSYRLTACCMYHLSSFSVRRAERKVGLQPAKVKTCEVVRGRTRPDGRT